MTIPPSRATAILFSFILAASAAITAAPNGDLEITKVQADAGNAQITISIVDQDDKLKGLPGVSLGGDPLVIVSATVQPGRRRPSAATIVAKLPIGVAPATYELVVNWGHDSTINTEITIGGQGPQGPQGIQGPAGQNGTNGTNGANGANGAPGAPGAGAVVMDVGPGGACGSVGGSSITDGAGHTSVVCDGQQGIQGPKGDPGTSSTFTTPLGATSGVVLNGGTGFPAGAEEICPAGKVGVVLNIGLDGLGGVESDLAELGLTCASVTVQSGFLGPYGAISARSDIPNLGIGATTNGTSACPLGMVMIGLVGTGFGNASSGGTDAPITIGARCASVGGATANGPVFGTNRAGTTSYDIECPQGQVVTGLQAPPGGAGATGGLAQIFGLVCQ